MEPRTLGHPLPTQPDTPTNSGYGMRVHPITGERKMHNGIDIPVPRGTPIGALDRGTVMFSGNQPGGAGNYVIVRYGSEATGFTYGASFHMQERSPLNEGDPVEKGQTIGRVGSTGASTGPHLHQEYFEGGNEALIRQGLIGSSGARRLDPGDYIGREYESRITIQKGDVNDGVRSLQQSLIERGYSVGERGADGNFGEDTRKAVVAFQRDRGLPEAQQDGIVGSTTRAQLDAARQENWQRPNAPGQTTNGQTTTTPTDQTTTPTTSGQTTTNGQTTTTDQTTTPTTNGQTTTEPAVLRKGDSGAEVTALQSQLQLRGYDLGTTGPNGDGVDGSFGDRTKLALEGFQRANGLKVDGVYGPETRAALPIIRETVEVNGTSQTTTDQTTTPPTTGQTTTPPTTGQTTNGQTYTDTPGPYAAVSTGDVFGTRTGTRLGTLNGEQSYALGRAVLGDGPGADALKVIDQQLGTGSGVFGQRVLAMGQHEGGLDFGRRNPDPAAGYNNGTFQLGGRGSTPESTAANYERQLTRGIEVYQNLSGKTVDRASLNVADKDVFAHIGYMATRGEEAFRTPLPPNQLLREMADPTITGDGLANLVSRRIQGGDPSIGADVVRMTDSRNGINVNMDAVTARSQEPDALRREPTMPSFTQRTANLNSDKGAVFSPAVQAWQEVLIARGIDLGPGGANGVYGESTRRATEQVQREAGLTADGAVGPATWRAYAGTGAQQVDGQTTTTPTDQTTTNGQTTTPTTNGQTTTTDQTTTPTTNGQTTTEPAVLRKGDSGAEVTALQSQLQLRGYDLGTTGPNGDGVDGSFGDRTKLALEGFQRANGLKVDGVYGPETRAALPIIQERVEVYDTPQTIETTDTTLPSGTITPRPVETLPPTTTGASTPNPEGASYMRQADDLTARILTQRGVVDVPGAVEALNARAAQPGTGPDGKLTSADLQQAFSEFANHLPGPDSGKALSKIDADALTPVLQERARLAGEGVTPEPRPTPTVSGDGASTTLPTVSPETPKVSTQTPTVSPEPPGAIYQ